MPVFSTLHLPPTFQLQKPKQKFSKKADQKHSSDYGSTMHQFHHPWYCVWGGTTFKITLAVKWFLLPIIQCSNLIYGLDPFSEVKIGWTKHEFFYWSIQFYLCASASSVAAAGGTIAVFAAEASTRPAVSAHTGCASPKTYAWLIQSAAISAPVMATATIAFSKALSAVPLKQFRSGVDFALQARLPRT